ncbi:hypothetical protein QTP86_033005 [Hemibagrus guttatus]|nr:hypothetical protein QTP86_033005 [Hemibagrus guttatus]
MCAAACSQMKSAGVGDGGLFTESYCNICNAQLISESQRVAHYESKKHANKVRLFYMLHPEDGGPPSKRLRPDNPDSAENEVDRNKCCTLCNMFFTSAIVAQSHYQGKTHAKRVRLVLGEQPSLPTPTDSTASTPQATDPPPPPSPSWHSMGNNGEAGKYCCLCGAWFNNPLMAQQHYEGKKHKRNAARARLLEQLAGSLDAAESRDLEKAYDRVPREELWYCMRKSGVAEKYVRVVQDMYERSRTVVRCAVGQTEEFNVQVGLHQGSALSPFLFAIVMDQLSEEVRQESPWTMMFADDIVICSESREQVEENLERWRFALERRGMKVSRSKTEYMCVNGREGSGTVRLQGEEVKKVQEFKYLGSTVQSNGECGKEVKKRVQAGWNGWRKVSGVLCDRKISARIKGKVYRTVVRPAMLYGLETVSLRKRQESELEVAELKMLRFSLGVTRLDRIRNEYIRGTAHVGRLGDKVREARLRWFGHVQRRESLRSSYSCSICNVVLNSIEQYYAHLQGSKHQNK